MWFALTDARALAAWFWPASMHPRAHSEPVVGGRFGVDAGDMGFAGQYRDSTHPAVRCSLGGGPGDDRDSRVTIELPPSGAGVDLVIVHDQVDDETAEMYRAGWESCLARLPAHLATPCAESR